MSGVIAASEPSWIAPFTGLIAYLKASGKDIDAAFEPWRDLITDSRALRLTVYDVADRLRSLRPAS
ncbi:hypothetical protein ACGFZK_07565 [Streptomyces sp. NPDC048257]|uniref:hypothetical protein n=1 Tax=Streptomyces sp. NPDC048257 TaxID=3365526 RepID=UPI00371CBF6A